MKMPRTDSMLRLLTDRPLEQPCDVPWEDMRGDHKIRRCDQCRRDVYSLSDMTELEAELRLLNAADALPCIRYARKSDGSIVHAAEVARSGWVPSRAVQSARALVAASALSTAIVTRDAEAKPKPAEPTQCVAYEQPAAPAQVAPAASGPRPAPAPAPSPPAPPVANRPDGPSFPTAGIPQMPDQKPQFGTLVVLSKIARTVRIGAVELQAPVDGFRMSEGDFSMEVTEANKKPRKVKLKITVGRTTTIDLDKR